MKHYINKAKLLTLLSVISLSLSSCVDFLIIEPKTFVTEDNFWDEKSDVEEMVAGVYCMLQSSDIISRAIVWGELRSDNITDGYNVNNNEDLYRTLRETLRPNNSYTNWEQFYKAVNAAQIIIERAPSVAEKDPTYTPTQVMATQAEMKAIRALCMFYLVRAFKDVPYPTHAVQAEDDIEPMPAHSGDSIINVLIADLEGCVSHALRKFPKDENRDHNSNYNRFTQSGIYALLCDLCLWTGDYDKVITYAEKVIDQKWEDFEETYSNNVNLESGGRPVGFAWEDDPYAHYKGKYKGYPLYPCFSGDSYGSSFNAIFGTGNSFESVFELAFTPSAAGGNYLSNSAVGSLYGSHGNAEISKGLLFAHEDVVSDVPTDKKKIFDHKYDIRFYTNFEPKDDQFNEGYPAKYVCNSISLTNNTGGTLPFKANYQGSSRSDRNWIFYRLTDVMLMQAEALVEQAAGDELSTDPDLQRAFGIIWAINRRSLMAPTINEPTGTQKGLVLKSTKYETKDAIRELVQVERRRELMFEGKRWFDLLRHCHRMGNTTDYVKAHVTSKGKNTGTILFANYEALYWPYYKRELKSNTALTQKPFYGSEDGEDREFQSSSKK